MEFDEIKFSRKTEIELKNYELLKSVFTKIYDTENELLNKRKGIFDDITKIPETENKTLTDIYSKFTSEMKALEEFRNSQMLIIKSKLIPATTYYSSKVKNYKKQIGNYKNKKKENEKQQIEMSKARASRNALKESQLNEDIKKSRNEMYSVGQNIQKDIMKFEADRVIDNKYIILHFIHCELAYHAKSLEKLSELYKTINSLEPKIHLKEFSENLQFNSVNVEDYIDEKSFTKKSMGRSKEKSFNKESLRVSGIRGSQRGMLEKTQKSQYDDELDEIAEEDNNNQDEL